ncbi:MAG: efflux RND transporter permease subunit [Rikenellaceae bacterium]|nr:efflux RND transporter permease subunit [Rikenellaceae bacterium]
MSLYKTAVGRPVTTILVFVAVAILGLFSWSKLPVDLYPDIETNAIMVMTTYAGASAADIETNVTRPLENTLNGVSDLKHITSNSKENISVISLEFEYGTDIDVATNDVRDKLDIVSSALPDEAQTPIIFKFGTDDIPIMLLSVTADESMPGLYKILDDNVATPLARIKGVGTVSISGIPEREIQVYCDPAKLEAYGLSIEGIAAVISAENRNVPAGNIDIGSNSYSLRVQKEFTASDQMLDLVVGSKNGATVYLRDVATISDTHEERSQEVFTNRKLGGMIMIQKQSGANSVDIANKVNRMLPKIEKTLPSDVKIGLIVNTSDNILNTINSLRETISITLIIVMLVVFIFLGRWRATFVVILTIPISLLSALIYLLVSGNTLNIISMSALSIAIGMVVDNAIVVLENITTHIERGSKPKQAAIFATSEVAISVIASTLTTVAVFLPLTMITGMAGILFKQLGWMVTIILTVSTIAAITLTPMLCSQMLRLDAKSSRWHKILFTPIERALGALNNGYARLLDWSYRHRPVIVIGAMVLFFGVIFGLGRFLKTEYFPTQDNGRISMTVKLPAGTRQEITRDLALRITDTLFAHYPEIKVLNFSEGQADTDNAFSAMRDNATYLISFNISLVSVEDRDRGLTLIGDLIRKDLDQFPEIRTYEVIEGGQSGGAGGQAAVDIEIFGYDFNTTDRLASDIAERMRQVKGCSQVNISRDEYTPEYQVDFDREKLAQNGLNMSTAASYLRNRINGSVASFYREDGDEYDIRVRYARPFRESVEDIENIIIYNNTGNGIKVKDLGKVIETQTPPTIERKDRERIITVSCVVGHDAAMSDIIAEASKVMGQVEIPAGITWQFGGTFEDQQDTFSDLFTLMALIIILVFIIMAAQFESFTYPFVIMFSIPFALVGVILGLLATGTAMGVMALLGILMLVGIVVNNGIVLVDYTNLCRERGMGVKESVVTAGRSRLRPVLMTTLTTVIGMIPLAIDKGEGAEMWRSMGLTVACGLAFSTVITLVLVPILYSIMADFGEKRKARRAARAARKAALAESNNTASAAV